MRPLAELDRECAIQAYMAGAEVGVYLQQGLLCKSVSERHPEVFPITEQ